MTASPRATSAACFAATYAALHVAHHVGDQWVQRHHQACEKALPGWRGWRANLGHVATYTATAGVALAAVRWRTGDGPSAGRAAAGLALIAVTHAWADRRHTLAWLADRVGKGNYYCFTAPGLSGAYHLDQSFHLACNAVAAGVMAA